MNFETPGHSQASPIGNTKPQPNNTTMSEGTAIHPGRATAHGGQA
ncbi:hypothetical protein ACGFMK_00710 [Amycolatopsis sp. NPDC049252]